MIASCPHCDGIFDTAKLAPLPPDQRPVEHGTGHKIDLTKETHVVSGSPRIDETTVKGSEDSLFVDPKTGKYTKDKEVLLGKDVTVTTEGATK